MLWFLGMTMAMLKNGFIGSYEKEVEELGETGLHSILDKGRKWDVADSLERGGSVVFPHAFIRQCGDQVAAAVHGCLDCGADRILVLGVDHALSEERKRGRRREFGREDLSLETCRGVFQEVEGEFSLWPFLTLWKAEVKRRGGRSPRLITRYPNLVNQDPTTLLGIEELEKIARDAVIVATGDLHHHGLAYRMGKEESLNIGAEAMVFAQAKIEEGFRILKGGNYGMFFDHTYAERNDGRDALSVLRHLKGPQEATILDLKLIDTAQNFEGEVQPSWVATSLVELN